MADETYVPPILDFAYISEPQFEMILDIDLDLHGLPADVYDVAVFSNPYNDTTGTGTTPYPERVITPAPTEPGQTTGPQVPIAQIRVILGQPMEGLNISGMISIMDQLETKYMIQTTYQLKQDQTIVVYYPDGDKLKLRITEPKAQHAQSTVAFQFEAVVT